MSGQRITNWPEAREAMGQPTPARRRLGLLFDPDSFVELGGFSLAGEAPCGVVCGYGAVNGSPVAAFAQDGGGFGRAQAEKLCRLYDVALKTGIPVVGVYDSAGANVAEGVGALAAYGDVLLRISQLSGVVPQISLIAGVCAGSSALLAMSADFVLMTAKAQLYVTPPALAADKAGAAGTAAGAAQAGACHLVADDEAGGIAQLRRMLAYLPLNNLAAAPALEPAQPAAALPAGPYDDTAPAGLAAALCDAGSVIELLGGFASGCAYTALAALGGNPVGIVGTRGKLCADGCNKIAKLVSVCDAFQIPVVTLVNTTGFEPSALAELGGAARELAKLAHVYAEATTPKAAVITARAYGAAYVALASRAAGADYAVAWPEAVLSPLEPQAAVAFLHGDLITLEKPRDAVVAEYEKETASALAAAQQGHLDDVIPPELTRPALLAALDLLSAKRVARNPKKHSNIPL